MGLRESRHRSKPLQGVARQRRWHPLGKVLRPPREIRHWLFEPGSLTQRLCRDYGAIRVDVLNQGKGRPVRDEGLPRTAWIPVRNVVLSDTVGRHRVVAHSILPTQDRGALAQMLQGLGRQALGLVLFSRPGFVRDQREWAVLDQRHALYRLAQGVFSHVDLPLPTRLWARRAVFRPIKKRTGNKHHRQTCVQVTEIFVGVSTITTQSSA